MKKITMLFCIALTVVTTSFARTGSGNCKVARIDLHDNGTVIFVNTTNSSNISSASFNINAVMGKSWLATLLSAKASDSYIYYFFDENSTSSSKPISKLEIK